MFQAPPPTEEEKQMIRQGFFERLVEFAIITGILRVIPYAVVGVQSLWNKN